MAPWTTSRFAEIAFLMAAIVPLSAADLHGTASSLDSQMLTAAAPWEPRAGAAVVVKDDFIYTSTWTMTYGDSHSSRNHQCFRWSR